MRVLETERLLILYAARGCVKRDCLFMKNQLPRTITSAAYGLPSTDGLREFVPSSCTRMSGPTSTHPPRVPRPRSSEYANRKSSNRTRYPLNPPCSCSAWVRGNTAQSRYTRPKYELLAACVSGVTSGL